MSDDMKRELNGVKAELGRLGGQFAALNADVSVLKTDVSTLKTDVSILKEDVTDIKAVNGRLVLTLVRLEGKFDDMSERMATKDDVSDLRGQVAGLAGKIDGMRLDWASHRLRLEDHEARITGLENQS